MTARLLCQVLQVRTSVWLEGPNTIGITNLIDKLCVN